MDIWSTLQIERTTDKRKIKKAYARLAAKFHPEEHPDEFQRIYAAYEEALKYAERSGHTSYHTDVSFFMPEETPKKPVHKKQQRDIDFERLVTPEAGKHKNEPAEGNREDIDFERLVTPEPERHKDKTAEGNREDIDFERLVQQETRKGLYVKSRDDKIDFSVLGDADGEDAHTKEIDALIGRFRIVIYDQMMRDDTRAWKRLLGDASFLQLHLERDFIIKFAVMFREVQPAKAVSRVIYDALDFPAIENLYEYEVYGELKEILLKDIKGKSRRVKHPNELQNKLKVYRVAGIFLGILSLIVSFGEPVKILMDTINGNTALEDALEEYLEEHYEEDFFVSSTGQPDDIMDAYYLMAEGKDVSDYRWFVVWSDYEDVDIRFYASWAEGEGFRFAYGYQLMFAILDYTNLSVYEEDIDKHNMEYYEKGERQYSYPVIQVTEEIIEGFYERLGNSVDLIAQSDCIFEEAECVFLNLHNPHTEEIYPLPIRQGETIDKEAMRKEVERVAGGAG